MDVLKVIDLGVKSTVKPKVEESCESCIHIYQPECSDKCILLEPVSPEDIMDKYTTYEACIAEDED